MTLTAAGGREGVEETLLLPCNISIAIIALSAFFNIFSLSFCILMSLAEELSGLKYESTTRRRWKMSRGVGGKWNEKETGRQRAQP